MKYKLFILGLMVAISVASLVREYATSHEPAMSCQDWAIHSTSIPGVSTVNCTTWVQK